jgi:hypothetical protein
MGAFSGFRRRARLHISIYFNLSLLIISEWNQDLSGFREVLAMGRTPQTIVTNFVNALWQDMLEKTPDELLGADRHGLCLSPIGILIPKANLAVVSGEDSAVSDGDTVNVTGEIIEDGTRALDGRFAVDDPVLLP